DPGDVCTPRAWHESDGWRFHLLAIARQSSGRHSDRLCTLDPAFPTDDRNFPLAQLDPLARFGGDFGRLMAFQPAFLRYLLLRARLSLYVFLHGDYLRTAPGR